MSQGIATALPVTVVCGDALAANTTVVIASTSGLLPGVQGWQDELPLSPLIPIDTMRGVTGFATVPQ